MWPRTLLLILVTPTPKLSSLIPPVKNPANKSHFFPKLVRRALWRCSSGILRDVLAEDTPPERSCSHLGSWVPALTASSLVSTVWALFYILVSVKVTHHFLSWASFCYPPFLVLDLILLRDIIIIKLSGYSYIRKKYSGHMYSGHSSLCSPSSCGDCVNQSPQNESGWGHLEKDPRTHLGVPEVILLESACLSMAPSELYPV